MSEQVNMVIFASGSGTNAENIITYFKDHPTIRVAEVFSNKADSFVHERARKWGIPSRTFDRSTFRDPSFLDQLQEADCIVLAGFLWLIPEYLIQAFPDQIINIHPSLLPKFGGKGMYGAHVHEAVVAAGEKESGITIHLVNEEYDQGEVLSQATCVVDPDDTADSLAKKIHQLEYEHFPKVIEQYLSK